MFYWRNPDGTIAIMAFAVEPITPAEIAATRARVVQRGRFPANAFLGTDATIRLPTSGNAYSTAWRFSADAVVVKLDLAQAVRWKALASEAATKIKELQAAFIEALMDNNTARQDAIITFRTNLQQLIATMPAEVSSAKTLAELDNARPAILDTPLP